jgi:hypothetical protein
VDLSDIVQISLQSGLENCQSSEKFFWAQYVGRCAKTTHDARADQNQSEANADHLSLEVRRELFGGAQIERRPRGASRAALAPTFVSGQ